MAEHQIAICAVVRTPAWIDDNGRVGFDDECGAADLVAGIKCVAQVDWGVVVAAFDEQFGRGLGPEWCAAAFGLRRWKGRGLRLSGRIDGHCFDDELAALIPKTEA